MVKGKPIVILGVSSRELYMVFDKYGYKDKSLISPTLILKDIPDEYKYLWWRGYADADGCYFFKAKSYQYNFHFSGNYNMDWSSVQNIAKELNADCKIYKRESNIREGVVHRNSRAYFSNKNDVLAWINYIYPSLIYDGIGLQRKFNKAMEIYNHHNR